MADAVGLAKDGPLLGDVARSGRPTTMIGGTEAVHDWSALQFVLRSLIAAMDLSERDVPQHVATLWAYKLGLEVMLPEIREHVMKKKELQLQQELCRFLVERHIHAYGTKFGPAQADLRASDALGTLMIETKLVKSTPSDSKVASWFSQLLSYMNQEPIRNHGALVLFNTGTVPIVTGDRILLIKQRLYVVPINLCAVSPSGRKNAIEILASPDPTALVSLRRPLPVRAGTKSTRRSGRR